jgi:hypothetical protein
VLASPYFQAFSSSDREASYDDALRENAPLAALSLESPASNPVASGPDPLSALLLSSLPALGPPQALPDVLPNFPSLLTPDDLDASVISIARLLQHGKPSAAAALTERVISMSSSARRRHHQGPTAAAAPDPALLASAHPCLAEYAPPLILATLLGAAQLRAGMPSAAAAALQASAPFLASLDTPAALGEAAAVASSIAAGIPLASRGLAHSLPAVLLRTATPPSLAISPDYDGPSPRTAPFALFLLAALVPAVPAPRDAMYKEDPPLALSRASRLAGACRLLSKAKSAHPAWAQRGAIAYALDASIRLSLSPPDASGALRSVREALLLTAPAQSAPLLAFATGICCYLGNVTAANSLLTRAESVQPGIGMATGLTASVLYCEGKFSAALAVYREILSTHDPYSSDLQLAATAMRGAACCAVALSRFGGAVPYVSSEIPDDVSSDPALHAAFVVADACRKDPRLLPDAEPLLSQLYDLLLPNEAAKHREQLMRLALDSLKQ